MQLAMMTSVRYRLYTATFAILWVQITEDDGVPTTDNAGVGVLVANRPVIVIPMLLQAGRERAGVAVFLGGGLLGGGLGDTVARQKMDLAFDNGVAHVLKVRRVLAS